MVVGLEIDSQILSSLLLVDVCQFFKMKPVNDFFLAVNSGAHLFWYLSTGLLFSFKER